MADPVAKGFVALVADSAGLKKDVEGLPSSLGGTFKGLGQSFGKLMGGDFGGAFKGVLSSIPGGLISPGALGVAGLAAAVGIELFNMGQEFHDAYNTIRRTTGASNDEMKELERVFKEVAKNTGASFDDIAQAVAGFYQRTGATGDALQDMSLDVLRLSKVTGTDLATNVELVSKLMTNWGIPAEEAGRLMDALYVASAKTGIGVDELAGYLTRFGPSLRGFGFGFDEAAATLAGFEQAGVPVTTAMTGLNTAFSKLAKSGEKDIPKAFAAAVEAIKNAESPAEATRLAVELFGQRAGPQLADAIREGRFGTEELTDALKNSEGALKDVAKETKDFPATFNTFKNQLKVALEPLAVTVFDTINEGLKLLGPALAGAAAFVGGFVTGVIDSFKSFFRVIEGVIDFVKNVFTGNWSAAWENVKQIFKDFVLGLLGIFPAIFEGFLTLLEHLGVDVRGFIDDVVDWFKDLPGNIVEFFKALPGQIMAVLGNLGELLLGWVKAAWDWVSGGIANAASAVFTWFTNLPGTLITKLGDLGGMLLEWAKKAFVALANKQNEISRDVIEWFKQLPGKFIDRLSDLGNFGLRLIHWASEAFKKLARNLGNVGKDVIDFFKQLPGKLLSALGDLGSMLLPDLSGLEKLPGQIGSLIGDVVDTIKGLPGQVTSALSGLGSSISSAITGALSSVTNLGKTIGDALKDLPNQITGALGNLGGMLTSTGKQIVQGLIDGWKSQWETLKQVVGNLKGVILGAIGDVGRWLWDKGKQVITGLVNGWKANWEELKRVARNVSGIVLGAIGDAGAWLKQKGKDIIGGLWGGIQSMKGWLQGLLKIGPWVWNAIGNAKDWLVDAGKNVIRGLWDGIQSMKNWIMDKMKGLLNGLKKLLPFSPPKDPTSPFAGRGQPIYSGMSIARQLAEGIEKATPLVAAAARSMAEAAQLQPRLYDLSRVGPGLAADLEAGAGGASQYVLEMNVTQADTSQMQAGFRRLELLSGAA